MALTEQDYEQIKNWFLSSMVHIVADEALSAITPLIEEKVNRCEEIYTVINKDLTNTTDNRIAKCYTTYLTGTSGQIDTNGFLSGNVSEMKNVSERFNRTGNFLMFSFDPQPVSIDYVEETKQSLQNVFNYDLTNHNNISSYLNVHTAAFNSFLNLTVIPKIDSHNNSLNAHENRFKNYYTNNEIDNIINNTKANINAIVSNNLAQHNNNSDIYIHNARFNTHDNDNLAHENRFKQYYLANDIDIKFNNINDLILTTANQTKIYAYDLFNNHNLDINAHNNLFSLKAPIKSPIFTGNVKLSDGSLISNKICTQYITGLNMTNPFIEFKSSDIIINVLDNLLVKNNSNQITLLDANNNTRFPGNVNATLFSSVNSTVTAVDDRNNNSVPNIGWCKNMFSEIMPYGSMPDYANMQILQTGKVSYIWKVNVPGYITVTFGHSSDVDYVLWAGYDINHLKNIKLYSNYVYKLAEGYGNADKVQSSIFVPIYPGTQTFILPYIDNSDINVSAMKWIFIPCMTTRQYESKRSQFIIKMSENLGSGHIAINSSGYQFIDKIFNTKTNANIWITNLN